MSAPASASTIAGQVLTADVSFEKATAIGATRRRAPPTTSPPRRSGSPTSACGSGRRTATSSIVRDGSGAFDIIGKVGATEGGIVGHVQATVELLIPGVSFSGTLEVQLNTLGRADPAPSMVDGIPSPGITVAGLDITLEVMGQRLTGDFAFAKNGSTGRDLPRAEGRAPRTRRRHPDLRHRHDHHRCARGDPRRASSAPSSRASSVNPDVVPADMFDLGRRRDRPAQQHHRGRLPDPRRVAAHPGHRCRSRRTRCSSRSASPATRPSISILGQTLKGVALFEQKKTATGAKIVRIAFAEVDLFLGDVGADGEIDGEARPDSTIDDVGLRLTNGVGAFIITPTGMAGEVSGAVELQGLPITIIG